VRVVTFKAKLFFIQLPHCGALFHFVVKKNDKLLAIKSNYKFFRKPIIPAGLKAFMRHYQQSQGIVVNKNLTKQSVYQQKSIAFKPIYLV